MVKLTKKNLKKRGGDNEKVISEENVEIIENSGYSSGVVKLDAPTDNFILESGRLSFIEQGSGKDDIVNLTTSTRGITKSLKRFFLSQENIFFNHFSGSKSGSPVSIYFANPYPGDVEKIVIEPGESYSVGPGCFLGCSSNLKVSAKFNWRGMITGEGIGLTTITNPSGKTGHAYVGCFGKTDKRIVKPGNELLVDNGLFLMSKNLNNKAQYELSKLPGLKSFFFGGEGILMKFKNQSKEDMEVYLQSRNVVQFANDLYKYMPKPSSKD